MAGNFHPASAPITAGRSLDAITLLQANGKLLAATDLDAVVRAATSSWAVWCREPGFGAAPGASEHRSLQVPLGNNCKFRFPSERFSLLPHQIIILGSRC